MDRYCIADNLGNKIHLPTDKETYLNVNFRQVIRDEIKKCEKSGIPKERRLSFTYQGMTNQYSWYQEDEQGNNLEQVIAQHYELEQMIMQEIPLSLEFEIDLIDEMLLCITQKEGKKEKLFSDDVEALFDNMKNTIHNRSKTNYVVPFDPGLICSESKKTEIPVLGSGVIRLWLSSSEFRRLLVENTTRFEKYETQNILDIFDNGRKGGIKYSLEDAIILEKVLGIFTGNTFADYIMSLLEKDVIWEKLLDILLEYEGEYSRCAIIQMVGIDLYNWKNQIRKIEGKQIETYIKILEHFKKDYNDIYLNSIETIKDICFSFKDLTVVRSQLLERRKEILRLGHPVFMMNDIYRQKVVKPLCQQLIKELQEKKTENEKIEMISAYTEFPYRLEAFYTEITDEGQRQFIRYKYLEEADKLNEIRHQIIQKNRKKFQF